MITARSLAVPCFWVLLSTPLIYAQDLSRYREFQFGMSLLTVAKQADVEMSEARVIQQHPAMIQELEWWPQHSLSASPPADSVKEVLFSFLQRRAFPDRGSLRSLFDPRIDD